MESALKTLLSDVVSCQTTEAMLRGKQRVPLKRPGRGRGRGRGRARSLNVEESSSELVIRDTVEACRALRKSRDAEEETPTDRQLSEVAEFVDGVDLESYSSFLHYVPRLVNVVRKQPLKKVRQLLIKLALSAGDARGGAPGARLGAEASPGPGSHR